ncbi:INVERT_DEFENSINS domain-containing protein [Nephila pilipes]|uniref:INVERT_DEFENSINS domain-containing protein n=1 Tax=Nephila pilipes TaxID=299642 RepID=A0A8X6TN37_NEPPI|nr:INVERT_DEFENSINS domain-containing protein [Nephila pilipes]
MISFPFVSEDETNCPPGEAWSECEGGCEHNCSNAGKPIICPRMCVPGCVCDDPGTVRGPEGNCIPSPLCPASPRTGFFPETKSTLMSQELYGFVFSSVFNRHST